MSTRRATRTVAPVLTPLTKAECKAHLLLASAVTGHDDWLDAAIEMAREQWEADTGEVLLTSTWTQTYDRWPVAEIHLLRRPVQSVSSIVYIDANGASQTWAASNYRLDAGAVHPRIVYDDTAVIPTLDDRPEAITVTYVCGAAAAANIPATAKHALLLAVAHAFEHRGMTTTGSTMAVPKSYESLAAKHARSSYP